MHRGWGNERPTSKTGNQVLGGISPHKGDCGHLLDINAVVLIEGQYLSENLFESAAVTSEADAG